MGFNLVDIILAGYVGWGVWRGRRRGLSQEATRLICLLLAVLTGYSLMRWTGRTIGEFMHLTRQGTGPLSVVAVIIATLVLVRRIRQHMRNWISQKVPDADVQRRGGAWAGGVRALTLGSTIVVFVGLMPLGFLVKPFSSGSFIGRNLIHYVVPIYDDVSETVKGKHPSDHAQ